MSVWDEVVGQEHALAVLRQAADAARAIVDRASQGIPVDDAARSMTHAWLILPAQVDPLLPWLLQPPYSARGMSQGVVSARDASQLWLGQMGT